MILGNVALYGATSGSCLLRAGRASGLRCGIRVLRLLLRALATMAAST